MQNYRYIKIFDFRGAPVYMHWPLTLIMLLVLLGSLSNISLAAGALSYWSVMFLHEAGHLYLAKKYHLHVHRIELSAIHGLCHHEDSEFPYINYMVAWGGFFAQAAVFVPAILILYFFGEHFPWYVYTPLFFLGYISFLVGIINIAPMKGLDGYECWKAIPIYLSRRKKQRKTKKKNPFKVVE